MSSRRRSIQNQRGISLFAISVWLIGIGIALAVALALLPSRSVDERIDSTVDILVDAQHELLSFVVSNGRLPRPDDDIPSDGLEDDVTSGALPHIAMELPSPVVDEASIPVRYAPYRNAGANADLADPASDYYDLNSLLPDYSGFENTDATDAPHNLPLTDATFGCPALPIASPVNLLDFCVGLDNATSADANFVNIGPSGANVPYALISGGLEDMDGDAADVHLDGANDDGDLSFDDPARGRTAQYDDIIRAITFDAMEREFSCQSLITSVDRLAAVADNAKDIALAADTGYSAAKGMVGAAVGSVFASAASLAAQAHALAGIAADIPKAVPLCNVPPNVTCCAALAALGASAVVYTVSALAELGKLIAVFIELDKAVQNRDLFRDEILVRAKINLCNAVNEAVGADARGGL